MATVQFGNNEQTKEERRHDKCESSYGKAKEVSVLLHEMFAFLVKFIKTNEVPKTKLWLSCNYVHRPQELEVES